MDAAVRLCSIVAVAITVYALQIRSTRRPKRLLSDTSARLLAHGQRRLVSRLLDVGGFFGVDIGGTLTKLVFFAPDKDLIGRILKRVSPAHAAEAEWHTKLASIQQLEHFILSRTIYGGTGVRDARLSFHMAELGGSFHFIRFETRRMDGAMQMAAKSRLNAGMHTMFATGGGSMKFADAAASLLGIHLESRDEIDCLVKGMAFLMAHVSGEAYTFKGSSLEDRPFDTGIQYPYLLVNIGSGVGFILVTSETTWVRVGGTSLGGGTFYGLVRCLTDITNFDEMLDLAEVGDNSHVDLTVGDIYGGDYSRFGLKASTIAASFGKAVTWTSARVRTHTVGSAADSDLEGGGEERQGDGSDGSFRGIGGPAVRRSSVLKLPGVHPSLSPSRTHPLSTGSTKDGYATPLATETGDSASGSVSPPGTDGLVSPPAAAEVTSSPSAHVDSRRLPAEASLPPDTTATERKSYSISGGLNQPSYQGYSRTTVVGSAAAPSSGPPGHPHGRPELRPQDVSRSLLIMLSNNIGQLAYLTAVRHKCKNVFFAGNFLRHENTIAMRTLAYAIQFWSKGSMEGLFLRHEGYCGALGAFLSTLESADGEVDSR